MKKPYIWGIIAVVVIIAAVAIYHFSQQSGYSNTGSNYNYGQNNPTPTPSSTPTPSVTPSPTTTMAGPRSGAAYAKAMNTYKFRLQFTQCHGFTTTNVGTLSIKKGDNFMLDNRDAGAHTFAFKGTSVRVPGDSFAIVSGSVTGSYPITCDGGGSALLNVN